MAALVDGCQYGLSSLTSTSADKSVLHVKLTDSALKAIEEFQKTKHATSQRPSIQFNADRGEIRVPLRNSSENPEGSRKFLFSVSSVQVDPKGSLNCLQQDTAHVQQLSLLGTMSQKLVVKATDDVYKMTKERMTLAEEKSKQSCAKEIKAGSSVRKVVKKVLRPSGGSRDSLSRHSTKHSAISHSHSHNKVSINNHRPTSLPLTSAHGDRHHERHHDRHRSSGGTSSGSGGGGGTSSGGPSSRHSLPSGLFSGSSSTGNSLQSSAKSQSSNERKSTGSSQGSRHSSPAPQSAGRSSAASERSRSSPTDSPHQSNQSSLSSSSSSLSSSTTSSSKPLQNITMTTKSTTNPAIMNTPLRDRIIHMVALRPYKKLELWSKLQKEGIRDRDKNAFGSVLKSVTQFNHRDNSLSLSRHIYQELRTDWPFYSEEERDRLRKKQIQEQEASSRTPSPAVSPVHSNSSQQGSPSTTTSQKRPSSTSEPYDFPSSKKQRIAHSRREREDVNYSPQQVAPSVPVKQEATSTSCESSLSVASQSRHTDYQEKENKDYILGTPSPEGNDSSHDSSYNAEPSSTSDTPEYGLKYTSISDAEQRKRYKQDFNSDYEVYMQLHANLDRETFKFQELRERLKQQEEGSEDYEKIKNTIFSEYYQLKNDPKYVEQRRRCDFLHRKLGHIKKLIVEYDRATATGNS